MEQKTGACAGDDYSATHSTFSLARTYPATPSRDGTLLTYAEQGLERPA